jgi:undecaprenyl diphosphate synthase
MPKHIAIIMDGNGRWAEARGLPRNMGHKAGIEATKKITKYAAEKGVEYLTLFGFSTENWKRPAEEVNELMRLLRFYLKAEMADLHRNKIRLRVIGFKEDLPDDIQVLIKQAEDMMADNAGLNLTIALNYGGRQDILQAAARMAQDIQAKDIEPDEITASLFNQYLLTRELPDSDLIIRTSGENRMSNFLLWQGAYTELHFTDTLWPDFAENDFDSALQDYKKRERRFGAVSIV